MSLKKYLDLVWNRIREKPENRISELMDKINKEYPELLINNEYKDAIKAYHEIKHIEMQKIYFFVIILLTATNVYLAYQNFGLQKSFILPVVGSDCTDFNSQLTYTFSFRNTGKSGGPLSIELVNNSVELYSRLNGIFLAPNDLSSFTISSKRIYSNEFNFSIFARTEDNKCFTKTCSYNLTDFTYRVVKDTYWQPCQ